ncbi:IclR family transcriptional regulator [Humibacillus sp. DSM 29435]|uniref:IclR family transcriptional regulator n=1 Tax=Humibacillus sp. DSM 29435 TaxID=1869167 RepID=UPI00087233F9|nr:IclR family transcriptional regulator [Humibacillus sp. DSM 29435]OFE17503.1 IclR family transcriptional regulator [Humibacillus sp. DSM 29435]
MLVPLTAETSATAVAAAGSKAAKAPKAPKAAGSGGVQSLDRAFAILETIADAGGVISLSQLATDTGLPLPTIHRLVRTLVDLGYVRQEPSRQYSLGPRLIRLGETTSRRLATWARPHLTDVVGALGESVNLAMLDGDQIVYIGQVMPSQHSMRMFTEVGRRVDPHTTAVGKAILANDPEAGVRALLGRTGMAGRTEHSLVTPDAFIAELVQVRERGYALDNQEQELGVRCVAVAVPGDSRLAISMSGPLTRMGDDAIDRAIAPLHRAADAIARELSTRS